MASNNTYTALLESVKELCENDEECKTACSGYLNLQVLQDRDVADLFLALAGLLLNKRKTLIIAQHFRQLLPQVLAVALDIGPSRKLPALSWSQEKHFHQRCCVALGKLISVHPDTIKFMLMYFAVHPAPFHDWESSELQNEPVNKKRKVSLNNDELVSDEEIALCCLSFLKIMTEHFRDTWDWSVFMDKYFNHNDIFVKWLACECSALLLAMSENEKQSLLETKFNHSDISACLVRYSLLRTEEKKHCIFTEDRDIPGVQQDLTDNTCDAVVSIGGVVLPIYSKASATSNSSIVLVDSTLSNLQAVALGVATGRPLCLQGPVGCGKTSLIEYLASLIGRNSAPSFLSVQLGDQTDSKMLLGTYQCTDIPGEFVWQPGVLTQAVVNGHWLLLEDIDSCSTDVAAVLSSLLETGTLNVPGYRDCVRAAPGFQLFLTQRLVSGASGFHKQHMGASCMLQKHWLPVQIEPLSQSELVEVVQTLYPSLKTVANRIVSVFLLFSHGSHHSALKNDETISDPQKINFNGTGSRLISTRDLIKWCNRAVMEFKVTSSESALKVLQDAIDIFCCNVSNPGTRLHLAESIAATLGVIHTKAEYFCNAHKPAISTSLSHVIAGRVSLPKKEMDVGTLTFNKLIFSFTRPAAALLERIACCVSQGEPVLLVGETGVGKTSSIQYLAKQMGHTLSVINMNQQSDSMDLLGGYKPVELKYVVAPIRDEFESLFRKFFSIDDNTKFLNHIAQCFSARRWTTLVSLMRHSTNAAISRIHQGETKKETSKAMRRKAKRASSGKPLKDDWCRFSVKLNKLEQQLKNSQSALAFAFVEGALIKAIKQGHWVLLDEINLANAQTLECLSGLLEGASGSLALLERGDREPIKRHPDFRIFAAMNPATDVGKKELPPGVRNRFTEFFVDELVDRNDLLLLCGSYLSALALPARRLDALVKFYLTVCNEAIHSLSDGTGQKPHYSLRTLCRALTVAANNPCGSIPRSLYEALLLSFLTQLDRSSHPIVERMVTEAVMGKKDSDPKSLVRQPIPEPLVPGQKFVKLEGYWVAQGSLEPHIPEKYILTPTVNRNLRDLVRVVSLARLPVLLQGETSVGKTSLITYLAEASGNRCLRINNHEHTDLQEYIGCYAADEAGNLSFKEGVLVEAMRLGHWIILDELNLAPSDVLEALNRVLDDNRELFIPETQKIVKAHPNFMLFATQNPPGLYGGRKVLSRAFRNRFIELHFDEIPPFELETILHLRCDMPPSYCKKMVAVMSDLQMRRKGSAAFAGKQGFITLRDLFRWGERYRLAQQKPMEGQFYDWDQHIADEGYLILAGRVRKEEERITIQECLAKHIKRSVDPEKLFTLSAETSSVTRPLLEKIVKETPSDFRHIVWTFNIRRQAVLLGKACEFSEPILLVGETGCGKTTLCQLLAASNNQELATVNCHMHTESADFLGGLRPVRDHSEDKKGKLFEWVDGPLIKAMLKGGLFLADEISLADDSVLERLNSLLEPERKLLLAEKGTGVGGEPCEVVAEDSFIFVGTMNPGGDYGKKELSPALRNRFTEIWCEGCTLRSDLIAVIEHNLRAGLMFESTQNEKLSVGTAIVDFLEWFASTELGRRFARSIRDVMTWVEFINVCTGSDVGLDLSNAYIHGAYLTFLDGLGSGSTSFCGEKAVCTLRAEAQDFLCAQVHKATGRKSKGMDSVLTLDGGCREAMASSDKFGIDPFYIKKGLCHQPLGNDFLLSAPTTRLNAVRVLRALQLGKALLLEGSPGVGKTSLVAALARATGHKLTRINLSDQTDVSDLFGSDLPVEGGEGGQFAWRDGPFLRALRSGDWILLDELNLASQSVLEGLNAVLDHRGDLFIPELGRTFHIQPGRTRLFACQNPLNQGGARKGLPQSFLNRFTQVFMETLTSEDLNHVCVAQFPTLPVELVQSMVKFNQRVSQETEPGGKWGQRGAPWEMNLRDLTRWCQATSAGCENGPMNPGRFVQLIYVDRMRSINDKEQMKTIYEEVFSSDYPLTQDVPQIYVTPKKLYVGDVVLDRGNAGSSNSSLLVLRQQLPFLQSLARCISLNWMSILVGPSGCGKTSLVHLLAHLSGQELRTLSVNSAMDTTEILGGFEQTDYNRHLDELESRAQKLVMQCIRCMLQNEKEQEAKNIMLLWARFSHHKLHSSGAFENTMESDVDSFLSQTKKLSDVLKAVPKELLSQEEHSQLFDLIGRTSLLQNRVANDGSLNAGGKFEWVDSILIKSLMDGCWLLVDNVNLCSAAVLDRLNGLLEPQGALTVGERGVGQDGELITVRPHPNFRLFLALDARNGEISRAMRNRGVEIFILSSEESVLSSLSALDRCALLHEVGVLSQYEQLLLLHIHELMADMTPGPEQPGLPELLHASFLVVQQIRRGMALRPALLSACTKVYIQSRIADSADSKRRALSVLTEAVMSAHQERPLELLDQLVSQATLRADEIYSNSRLAMVKQRCSAISAIANVLTDAELAEVEAFLGISQAEVDVEALLKCLVVLFYQTASLVDVHLGHEWLVNAISNTAYGGKIKVLSEDLVKNLEFICDLAEEDMIWDRRWLPDVAAAITAKSKFSDHGVENRVSLLLYFTSLQFETSHSSSSSIAKKSRNISVLDYSRAVHKGIVSDSLSDEPLVLAIGVVLDTVVFIMRNALASVGLALNDTQWWSARVAMMWLDRILKQASSLQLGSDSKLVDETVSHLSVFFRWFLKHTMPVVNYLMDEALMTDDDPCTTLKENLALVANEKGLMWRFAKRIRQEVGQPLPLSSAEEASYFVKMSRLNSVLNLWPAKGERLLTTNYQQQISFLLSQDGKKARLILSIAVRDLFTHNNFENVRDKLDQVEEWCSKGGLLADDPCGGEETETLPGELSPEVILWPFKELVCLTGANAVFARVLAQRQSPGFSNSETSHLLQLLRVVPSIPAALVGCLEALSQENTQQELPYILWYHKFATESLAVTNVLNLIATGQDIASKRVHLQQHCPVLSYQAALLLFNQSPSSSEVLSSTSLNQHESRSKMLQNLRSILWCNAASFSDSRFSYRSNEIHALKKAVQYFIHTLEKCLNIASKEENYSSSRAQIISENLQSVFGLKFPFHLLETLLTTMSNLDNISLDDDLQLLQAGHAWALLGFLESQIYGVLPPIDPKIKHAIKLQFVKEEVAAVKCELHAAKVMSSVQGSEPDSVPPHPHLNILQDHFQSLLELRSTLSRHVAARPDPPLYGDLKTVMHYYMGSICAKDIAMRHIKLLTECTELHEVVKAVQGAFSFVTSQRKFRVDLEKRFGVWYPDIVQPILESNAKLCHGLEILISMKQKLTLPSVPSSALSKFICSLGRFPLLSEEQPSLIAFISALSHKQCSDLLKRATTGLQESDTPEESSAKEVYWLLKSAVLELRNLVNVSSVCDGQQWQALMDICRSMTLMWEKQEFERRERELDKESLYKSRGSIRCQTLSEEEQIDLELSQLFPSSRNEDFGDLELQDTLDDSPDKNMEVDVQKFSDLLTEDDAAMLCFLHISLVQSYSKVLWMEPVISNSLVMHTDFITPWLQRCGVAARLLVTKCSELHDKIDKVLSTSWILAATLCSGRTLYERSNESAQISSYDFYHSPNTDEVRQCYPVMKSVASRVEQLLAEWPNHPSLNQIIIVIKRVSSFPVTSPVARFLTGLEILLTKMKDWEENAHEGVSLASLSASVTNLIIQWRRLELACWKSCLDAAAARIRSKAARWWFYLFGLVEAHLRKSDVEEDSGMKEIVGTLEKFMEVAPLGEFHIRLEMLLAFHCHIINLPASYQQKSLLLAFWNIHNFYSQFSDSVTNHITTLRAPIDKSLKDYVKIARWNDINYWAIKEAVLRTQRTLHKHVRDFEAVLKKPCKPVLVATRVEGKQDPMLPPMCDPKMYVATVNEKDVFETNTAFDELMGSTSLIVRAESLFTRARKLSKEMVLGSSCPGSVASLNAFVGEIITSVQHLAELKVDDTLSKSKRVSQAKSQLQVKRKALADLFRTLQHIGLSYRTGLIYQDDFLLQFTALPPLRVNAMWKNVLSSEGISLNSADNALLAAWGGCDSYLLRAWARFAHLRLALQSPHKEIGPSNLERLKGFPCHLLALTFEQHKAVDENISLLLSIRVVLHQLFTLKDNLMERIPCQSTLSNWKKRLVSLLVNTIFTLQQFRLLLEACPESSFSDESEESIPVISPLGENLPDGLGMVKSDSCWQKVVLAVDRILTLAKSSKEMVDTASYLPQQSAYISSPLFQKMRNAFTNVKAMADELHVLQNLFESETLKHPVIDSIVWLKNQMHTESSGFFSSCNENSFGEYNMSFENFHATVNSLLEKTLLAIQAVYKLNTAPPDPESSEPMESDMAEVQDDENDEDENMDLQEKHLSEMLHSVKENLKLLKMTDISSALHHILKELLVALDNEKDVLKLNSFIRLVLQILPVLEQWVLLCQFAVEQQVAAFRASSKLLSVILAVFSDVACKGFCTPEDLVTTEEGEGEGQSEGMGLGEGEGEKDVSNRITSEDQLEGAHQEGKQEEKEEDKDCKEEQNAIEMSDNFDSKQQDIEEKDEDEDEGDGDNDDAEKEMGDTEKGADQLDKQIWGSDSEDEGSDDEDGEGKEDDGNSGEQIGEKEMGAQEKESKNQQNEDEKEGKEKETSKPDINEMKDPEENDDQIDPYHGNQQPEKEPEPMDLPEDLQLDEEAEGKDEDANEENPFDIDDMKEKMPLEPEEKPEEGEGEKGNDDETDNPQDGASDEEEPGDEDQDADEPQPDEEAVQDDVEDREETEDGGEGANGRNQEDEEPEPETGADEKELKRDDEYPARDDNPTGEEAQPSEDTNRGSAAPQQDAPQVSGEQPQEEMPQDGDPNQEEREAVGEAPTTQQQKGHHDDRSGKRPKQDPNKRNEPDAKDERQQRPGHSDEQRSLGDASEPQRKRLKTVDVKETDPNQKEDETEEEGVEKVEDEADLYQHIKDAKEHSETQTLDAATEDQAEQQPVASKEDEVAEPPEDEHMDVDTEEEPESLDEDAEKLKEEKVQGKKKDKEKKEKGKPGVRDDQEDDREPIEVDGDRVDTLGAARGPDTTFHTRYEALGLPNVLLSSEVEEKIQAVRLDLQNQLASWNQAPAGDKASQMWQSLSSVTNALARDLSEQLRLVLEPTQASRLKGDFRTGRRINMRKVIPFIASQFRKDKIWMRRTKPSKREYQIVLAVDDSSSMADNRSKELAFESLALVSQALTLLEAGDLGVLSFGETIKILHKLGEPFTHHSGARLLQQFSFDQRKTQIGALMDFVSGLMSASKVRTTAEHAQLVVVVSDGRGVFSEGYEKVNNAIRQARLAGVFMVFVIIDNPENKDSILDIRTPLFKAGKLIGISSYMDSFPFPFYLILRDIANLPIVLSDALRQWFELVTSSVN